MDDLWDDYRYVPQNVPQWCQGTDLTRKYNGRRESCDVKAEHFFGGWDTYFIGFCPKHWDRFKKIVTEELWNANFDHWMFEAVIRRGARILIEDEGERQMEIDRLEMQAERDARREVQARPIEAKGEHAHGVVYFIQQGDAGPIKIGTTRKLASRFDVLQTASPYTLHLRATQPGDVTVEREYHRLFRAHRLSGEWFEPIPAILAVIDQINAGAVVAPAPKPGHSPLF